MSKFQVKNARLSFPSLFHKAVFNGAETKFGATFLVAKGSAQEKMILEELEKFKATLDKSKLKGLKITSVVDGDDKEYDGYEGMTALRATNQRRPTVVDKDRTQLTEEDNRLYAGCYVNAIVEFWFSDHPLGGKQILATLHGVQFYKDGDSFSDFVASKPEDFDEIDEDEDDDVI